MVKCKKGEVEVESYCSLQLQESVNSAFASTVHCKSSPYYGLCKGGRTKLESSLVV